ncbi:MAG: hypothetical protein A3G32_09080 [Deltaproteobacteria bacterium RIFCSPLOWO2_12_FULL_40_28]|nr:MAG: hypothetical protein A3C45_07935 [Deltaproteobacteria bacterium RIFCSPHIGHO2_02_FULL_40_28]OGQ21173.1 MAG: hypothetical protein A3E27_01570 [Deltaproteobacteria bacterium RIFCSPHIGHO2_12_FULL_40_32]OGQ39074.1 MAG: hypothetical protein A3I69_09205 [Deltaproteobacteria bacterium RIFCSPLOWO2_02_FULL_40_36]OGQ53147.1 MAG: hypothetical protein A3G32_09080 [Deltaproteobacteria bacterium RIFCSPLOWO2_12_FULL_40_28]
MNRLFWLDMEMTGLDENKDHILELAVIITDLDFNILEEYQRVVFQPPEVLEAMNEWCKKNHGKSGLTQAVPSGTPLTQVENELLALTAKHFGSEKRVILCGNSIGNDQRFVLHYLPRFAQRLHYRMIDVTSFKEIFRTKYKIKFTKQERHRALDDIKESIEELKTYLGYVKIEGK